MKLEDVREYCIVCGMRLPIRPSGVVVTHNGPVDGICLGSDLQGLRHAPKIAGVPLNPIRGGIYPHPSFERLHDEQGSGIYVFTERLGLGGIFRLTSRGAIPLNPDDTGPDVTHHDVYDVLRAVDEGKTKKLTVVPKKDDMEKSYEN